MNLGRQQARSPARYRRVQNVQTNTVTVSNSAAETTLHTFTSSGDAPGPSRIFRLRAAGTATNTSGGPVFLNVRLYLGTGHIQLLVISPTGGIGVPWQAEATAVVTAGGTAGTVWLGGTLSGGNTNPIIQATLNAALATNLSSSLVLKSTLQFSTAAATISAVGSLFLVETE